MASSIQTRDLYGGTVTGYRLDIRDHTFQMTVDVNLSGSRRTHTVQMAGVASFSVIDEATLGEPGGHSVAWEYIELTSIVADRVDLGSSQFWKVRMEWWLAQVEVICSTFTCD